MALQNVFFKIEDTLPETEEPVHPVTCGEIQTIEFKKCVFRLSRYREKNPGTL